MDMSSLFPSDGVGNVLSSAPSPHVSFRAGMLTRDPTTSHVTADPRKGTFQITTSSEDGLMHLQWRPRNNPTVEHDLILFSGETEMKQVMSCPASARVYVLKWREADTRLFFWMQGRDPSQDAANIAAVNAILENGPESQQPAPAAPPAAPPAVEPSSTPPANPSASRGTDVVMDARPPEAANTAAQSRDPITLDQIRAALSRRTDVNTQRELLYTTPTIVDLLNMETLQPLLATPRIQSILPRLFEHLPEQDRSLDRLTDVLRSPPLRGQAASLSNALQSGDASDILRSFGLPIDETLSPYGLKAFLEALVKHQKNSNPDQ